MSEFESYEHHGTQVYVRSSLKGKYREHCLCYSCDHFKPESRRDNCGVAEQLYQFCVDYGMTTPVFECPFFKEKT